MLDVEVTVVGNPGATDGAPVAVHVVRTAVEDALAVPVTRCWRWPAAATRSSWPTTPPVVPVELGAFADGYVQVRARASARARASW